MDEPQSTKHASSDMELRATIVANFNRPLKAFLSVFLKDLFQKMSLGDISSVEDEKSQSLREEIANGKFGGIPMNENDKISWLQWDIMNVQVVTLMSVVSKNKYSLPGLDDDDYISAFIVDERVREAMDEMSDVLKNILSSDIDDIGLSDLVQKFFIAAASFIEESLPEYPHLVHIYAALQNDLFHASEVNMVLIRERIGQAQEPMKDGIQDLEASLEKEKKILSSMRKELEEKERLTETLESTLEGSKSGGVAGSAQDGMKDDDEDEDEDEDEDDEGLIARLEAEFEDLESHKEIDPKTHEALMRGLSLSLCASLILQRVRFIAGRSVYRVFTKQAEKLNVCEPSGLVHSMLTIIYHGRPNKEETVSESIIAQIIKELAPGDSIQDERMKAAITLGSSVAFMWNQVNTFDAAGEPAVTAMAIERLQRALDILMEASTIGNLNLLEGLCSKFDEFQMCACGLCDDPEPMKARLIRLLEETFDQISSELEEIDATGVDLKLYSATLRVVGRLGLAIGISLLRGKYSHRDIMMKTIQDSAIKLDVFSFPVVKDLWVECDRADSDELSRAYGDLFSAINTAIFSQYHDHLFDFVEFFCYTLGSLGSCVIALQDKKEFDEDVMRLVDHINLISKAAPPSVVLQKLDLGGMILKAQTELVSAWESRDVENLRHTIDTKFVEVFKEFMDLSQDDVLLEEIQEGTNALQQAMGPSTTRFGVMAPGKEEEEEEEEEEEDGKDVVEEDGKGDYGKGKEESDSRGKDEDEGMSSSRDALFNALRKMGFSHEICTEALSQPHRTLEEIVFFCASQGIWPELFASESHAAGRVGGRSGAITIPQEDVDTLLGMGFSKEVAERAYTEGRCRNLQEAVEWIMDHQ